MINVKLKLLPECNLKDYSKFYKSARFMSGDFFIWSDYTAMFEADFCVASVRGGKVCREITLKHLLLVVN